MIKVAPSILSADFACLAEEIKVIEKNGADYLHLDVMDGHFVPNITIGPPVVAALRSRTSLTFDVHLMVRKPDVYVQPFLDAGADIITVHAETGGHLHRTLTKIKEGGARTGIALNPATSPEIVKYLFPFVDLVLIMTVNPGFGGQNFIPEMLSKIEVVKKMLSVSGSSAEIEVDGGIDEQTAPLVVQAGATVLVAGAAVFGAADPGKALSRIKECCWRG